MLPPSCDAVRLFRSSGTTDRDRARSHFSAFGLEAYRLTSTFAFIHALNTLIGDDARHAQGITLIPPVVDWPDSSLAQMVAWIAALLPVQYAAITELPAAIARADGRPVWIFGTAFHFAATFEQFRTPLPLPPRSAIIETGGLKGKGRALTRCELYQIIADGFKIGANRIASEYGMSELAAQAYDIADTSGRRRFVWPAWVDVRVMPTAGTITQLGRGALVVRDPMRLDLPVAVRTEDFVELTPSGMELIGRLPSAPLKGCSTAFEDLLSQQARKSPTPTNQLQSRATPAQDLPTKQALAARAVELTACLDEWLGRLDVHAALAKELGSPHGAQAALDDLKSALPKTSDEWLAAGAAAVGCQPAPKSWLVILPDNHSLVGLYPLCLLHMLGLSAQVRVPASFRGEGVISSFVKALQALNCSQLETLPGEWRLVANQELGADAILAFGDDFTLSEISEVSRAKRFVGFGHRVAIGATAASQFAADARLIVRDVLSLGQRGCMAVRLLIVTDNEASLATLPDTAMAQILSDASASFWGADFPELDAAALDLERARLESLGCGVPPNASRHQPLVAIKHTILNALDLSAIEQLTARRPFSFVIIRVRGAEPREIVKHLMDLAKGASAVRTLTVPTAWLAVENSLKTRPEFTYFRPLGCANRPAWNGLHDGVPLLG